MVKRTSESDSAAEGETPSSPTLKKAKLSKEKLYKPPTSEELANLKETQNLYQSGIFRLKVRPLKLDYEFPITFFSAHNEATSSLFII